MSAEARALDAIRRTFGEDIEVIAEEPVPQRRRKPRLRLQPFRRIRFLRWGPGQEKAALVPDPAAPSTRTQRGTAPALQAEGGHR